MPQRDESRLDVASAVLLTIAEGVAIFDQKFELVAWNEPFVRMGIAPRERVRRGLSIAEVYRLAARAGVLGPGDPERIAAERLAAVRAGQSPAVEDIRGVDGRIIEIRRYFLAELGVAAIFADVTELRRAEARLRRADSLEVLGRVAGGLAHDFNNLLTVIIGHLEAARTPGASAEDPIEVALAAATRGADLTRSALSFAGNAKRGETVESISDCLAEALRFVEHMLPAAIETRLIVASEGDHACVDRSAFVASLVNLALNARDAMPEGGLLEFRCEVLPEGDEGRVCVRVADTGHGMDGETLARVTEPFFTTKSPDAGIGLGLYEVSRFAEAAGGEVRIDSSPGEGTRVEIVLPRAAGLEPVATVAAEAVPTGHVLLVDDDEGVRRAVRLMLEHLGFSVTTASSAEEAEQIFSREACDVLIADYGLQGTRDGADLIRSLRETHPEFSAALCTGFAEPSVDPSIPVLPKPFRKDDLLAMISSLMGGAAARGR